MVIGSGPSEQGSGVLTVYYDADCGFCTDCMRVLDRLDRGQRLRLVPLHHAASERPDSPALSLLMSTMHAVDGERWWTGGAACLEIAARVPALRPLTVIGRVALAQTLAERAYRFVAANRGRLPGRTACALAGRR